jgi:hypothetical protein
MVAIQSNAICTSLIVVLGTNRIQNTPITSTAPGTTLSVGQQGYLCPVCQTVRVDSKLKLAYHLLNSCTT